MKLAEALSRRKDLQKRIAQLRTRAAANVKVQEGEQPMENPAELRVELHECLQELEDLIWRINVTNMQLKSATGVPLTRLLAQRDVLTARIAALRQIFEAATETSSHTHRYVLRHIVKVTACADYRLRTIESLTEEFLGFQGTNFYFFRTDVHTILV